MTERVNIIISIEGLDERLRDEMKTQLKETIRRVSHKGKRENDRESFSRVRIADASTQELLQYYHTGMTERVNIAIAIEGLDERLRDEMMTQINKTIRRVSHKGKRENDRESFYRVRITCFY